MVAMSYRPRILMQIYKGVRLCRDLVPFGNCPGIPYSLHFYSVFKHGYCVLSSRRWEYSDRPFVLIDGQAGQDERIEWHGSVRWASANMVA